jgi:iron complex transport system ATP-binding protein
MVEHDLNLAAMLAQRVLLLAEGRLFADGPPEEVLSEANVAQAFGVQVRRERDPATGRPILLPREDPDARS